MSFLSYGGTVATREDAIKVTGTAYAVALKDRFVAVTSGTNVAITLPELNATGADNHQGMLVSIATWGSATVVVGTPGSDTIGGSATKTLAAYSAITVMPVQTSGWAIVGTSGTVT